MSREDRLRAANVPAEDCCDNCFFYREKRHGNEIKPRKVCKRLPPLIGVPIQTAHGPGLVSFQSGPESDDWCAEHKRRQDG